MKSSFKYSTPGIPHHFIGRLVFSSALLGFLAFSPLTALAGIAYGSINNFDTVNDTGVPCHGFEIELPAQRQYRAAR